MNTVQAVFLRWTRISKRTLLSFFAKIISKFFFCQVKVGASNCISLIVQFWCGWIKLTMALGFSSRNQWNKTCSQFPHKVSSWFFFWGGEYAQNCLRPSYYKEKIPYDKMDSKIKLLHVIIGLINKGKQRQKSYEWSCHFFLTPVCGVQVVRIIRTI